MDLIADIGATTSRCALIDADGAAVTKAHFENSGFAGLEELLDRFVASSDDAERPSRAALAIAAPVLGDRVEMLNRAWHFSQARLREYLGVAELIVVNDFAAVAWALPALGADQRRQIGAHGKARPRAPLGALGPGSGLGVGGLVPAADGWAVVTGEGGHVTLPPTTPLEARIMDAVRDEYGHCSAERLLSGPGLVRIHAELAGLRGRQADVTQPADVTMRASRGDALAAEAMQLFFEMLGTVAGNLALTLGAHGGVYIAGGIVPRVADAFERSGFRERFVAKGRYRGYLEAIPTYLITEPVPAFLGLKSRLLAA